MKTDIEIARETPLKNINEVCHSFGIDTEEIYQYGKYMAKLPISLIDEEKVAKNNLVLVTAITPTKSGNGKTTVSISLALGLNKIGKKSIAALREPSLGPCFGMKGGAAGGGYSQVLPMENINLHFTGDFHAITSAHNMITAMMDNYIYQNRGSLCNIKDVRWKRVIDVNDRSLRNIVVGLGSQVDGVPTQTAFDITPASEIMAIMCFATSLEDLRRRIENILLGFTCEGKPFTVKDLGIAGSIVVLLKDALMPNVVQTTENTPAIIHAGPFANIAHGCNSILATKMAMSNSEYTITEAGFGADLGAEKFLNIKCRRAGLQPKLTVLIATVPALKMHGGVNEKELKAENLGGVEKGFENLDKHISDLQAFGQTVVVTLNRFPWDTDAEIELLRSHCKEQGIGFAINEGFSKGGDGGVELAQLVVDTIEKTPSKPLVHTYDLEDDVKTKIEKVATKYGARKIQYSNVVSRKIKHIESLGMKSYPICVAKTQYSFSDDSKAYGVAKDFDLTVRDVFINNGAEMLVVVMGEIMRMPGLPKVPNAVNIDIVNGEIEGLS